MRRAFSLITVAVGIGALWFYRGPLLGFVRVAENHYFPCRQPVLYTFGTLDSQFNISKEDFLEAIQQAEGIWEAPIGRDLLAYDPTGAPGDLVVNLVYDERQQSTQRLQSLGLAIDTSKKTYDSLSSRYDDLKATYTQQKNTLAALVASYQKEKDVYESKVNYWNARGGAPEKTYAELTTERQALDALASRIRTAEANLNTLGDNINALVVTLNRIAATLNISTARYNTLGNGETFEEGVYKSDVRGREIDIYQFDNHDKLVRVLAHELGHALGLNHVDDPTAIMYKLNQGSASKASQADIAELKTRCGLE